MGIGRIAARGAEVEAEDPEVEDVVDAVVIMAAAMAAAMAGTAGPDTNSYAMGIAARECLRLRVGNKKKRPR